VNSLSRTPGDEPPPRPSAPRLSGERSSAGPEKPAVSMGLPQQEAANCIRLAGDAAAETWCCQPSAEQAIHRRASDSGGLQPSRRS
jgi:hypothetical protein